MTYVWRLYNKVDGKTYREIRTGHYISLDDAIRLTDFEEYQNPAPDEPDYFFTDSNGEKVDVWYDDLEIELEESYQ